jgi:hypothetical protein
MSNATTEIKDKDKDKKKSKEKEAAENTEYENTLTELAALYKTLVLNSKEQFDNKAKEFITRLYNALKRPTPDGVKMSASDIKRHIIHDVRQYWSKQWIEKNLPQELVVNPQTAAGTNENAGAGGTSTALETGKGEGEQDPKEALIKELKQEKKLALENVATLQRLQEKNNKKMSQMTEQMTEQSKIIQEFKDSAKLISSVKQTYNKQLHALEVIITGVSIQRMENFVKSPHALGDKVKIVLKIGDHKEAVIDSLEKAKEKDLK